MPGKGVFITFEGGEGTGKSTHVARLTARLESTGFEVCCIREPGGTAVGEKVRSILLDKNHDEMDPLAELLLYEAARAQIIREIIEPALAAGKVVICDRFIDSTVAYQGYGRGLDLKVIRKLNRITAGSCIPDRTILLLVDPSEGLRRATKSCPEGTGDRIEDAGSIFHQRVYDGFKAEAAADPQRIRCVETMQSKGATQEAIFHELADLFSDGRSFPQSGN